MWYVCHLYLASEFRISSLIFTITFRVGDMSYYVFFSVRSRGSYCIRKRLKGNFRKCIINIPETFREKILQPYFDNTYSYNTVTEHRLHTTVQSQRYKLT